MVENAESTVKGKEEDIKDMEEDEKTTHTHIGMFLPG